MHVFINGVIGVFAGLTVLYLAVKLNQLLDSLKKSGTEESP